MKIDFKRGERHLKLETQEILLPGPIWHIHAEQQKVIVVLDPNWGLQNVLCFDESGKLLWVIAETDYFKGTPGPGYEAVYRLGHNAEKELAASVRGRPFLLDIETGKVAFIPGDFER